jgi:dihydroxyacetone kinase-like predicted kinase
MLRYLRGQSLDAAEAPQVATLDLAAVGAALDAAEPGQEWEVVLDFRPNGTLHLPTLFSRLEEMGTSIQVGEGDGLYRIHVHLLKQRRHEPIELAEEMGTVVKVHMENLLDQLAAPAGQGDAETLPLAAVQPGQIGVVAVSPGHGLSRVMASLGVAAIVGGGQTMNPSTQDILDAVGNLPTDRVIVLPNNKNIIPAAIQAAEMSVKQVRVVPTRTIPQGIAALLGLVPDGELDAVQAAMERAQAAVESGEVTTASRSVDVVGVSVQEGQFIGLHNTVLKTAGETLAGVVLDLLDRMGAADRELATLFYGADVDPASAEQIAAQVRAAFPNLEIERHPGGQPYYHFILSLE